MTHINQLPHAHISINIDFTEGFMSHHCLNALLEAFNFANDKMSIRQSPKYDTKMLKSIREPYLSNCTSNYVKGAALWPLIVIL